MKSPAAEASRPVTAADVLYKDKFVEIYSDHLSIKCFYFPFAGLKRVDIGPEVSFATDQDLGFTWKDRKTWGMALNNVWWALDWSREIPGRRRGIVLTVGQETFRKGFSVEDEESATRVLASLLSKT